LGIFWKPNVGQAVACEGDLMDMAVGIGEQAAVPSAVSAWLRKRGDEKFLLKGAC
jgi:hypothetical protein